MTNIGFNNFNAYSRISYGLNAKQLTAQNAGIVAASENQPVTTSTMEVCASNFNFDNYTDFWRTLGKGIYKEGDTVTFVDANGTKQKYVARRLDDQIIFDNGSSFIKDQAR